MSGASALRATVLGCGTSIGVPVIGCRCRVCTSDEPKNRRLRTSLCLRHDGKVILIDTSPDLRQQCLTFGVERVDAVLFTHAHADHIFGLDDLRAFNFLQVEPIPCYASPPTLEHLHQVFGYVFDGVPSEGGGKPRLRTVAIAERFEVCGLEAQALPVLHGSIDVTAYRFGRFAYVTDCNDIPQSSFEALADVDTLILDALRYEPHPTHFSVSEAIDVARRLGARVTYLTHMNHDIDYSAPEVELPPGVELAYDGLTLDIPL